jgi:chromate transporter
MMAPLAALAVLYAQLSLIAIGGANVLLPEMQRQVVDVRHWMSAAEFAHLFALAQAAPGPNMLIVTLVGWRVAGLAGALVATISLVVPAACLCFTVTRAWDRFREQHWRRIVQAALTPVTVGLVLAAAVLLGAATARSVGAVLVTLAVAACALGTRLNPLWLLAAGAAIGVAGLI